MSKYCTKCGAKQEDSSTYCNKCGALLNDTPQNNNSPNIKTAIKCIYCGSEIPLGSDRCFVCGKYLDPSANKEHTAAIVIGYICSFIPYLQGIAFILGIYLLTRKNKNVHIHGIIILVICIIVGIIVTLPLIVRSFLLY